MAVLPNTWHGLLCHDRRSERFHFCKTTASDTCNDVDEAQLDGVGHLQARDFTALTCDRCALGHCGTFKFQKLSLVRARSSKCAAVISYSVMFVIFPHPEYLLSSAFAILRVPFHTLRAPFLKVCFGLLFGLHRTLPFPAYSFFGSSFRAQLQCLKILVVSSFAKVWSLDVNASCTRMVTGASDNQLRVWSLEAGEETRAEDGGNGSNATDNTVVAQQQRGGEGDDDDVIAVYMGSVARQGNGKHTRERRRTPFLSRGQGLRRVMPIVT